jgi:hypothetical protein
VPFNPLEILWDPRQSMYLLAVYLLLALPFMCAGACICMTFARWRGCPRASTASTSWAPAREASASSRCCSCWRRRMRCGWSPRSGLAAAASVWLEGGGSRRWLAVPMIAMAGLPWLVPAPWIAPTMSSYKGLSQTLRIPGARVVEERSSPLGLVSVVESPRVPLRHAPGLSLAATVEPPPQLGLFIDGEGMSALTRFDGRRESLAHLDQMTSALPYHLLRHPRVLVLGAGAGADVLQAHYHGAAQIDAVELNPKSSTWCGAALRTMRAASIRRHRLGRHLFGDRARARRRSARLRRRSAQRHDLIQVALLDSFSASSAGLYALSENYLYTVEALQDALRHLEPGGLLAITRWVTLPPRDALRSLPPPCWPCSAPVWRSRIPDRAGSQLADEHAARQERRLRGPPHRRDQGLLWRARFRCGVLSRHAARGSESVQRGRTPRPVRRRDGTSGGQAATNSCAATSSTSLRPPTTGRTSSTSSSGARCPSCCR